MATTIEAGEKTMFLALGTAGEGGIQADETQQERLQEITERIGSGEFHVATEGRIPSACIDGRCGCSLMPNSAGGSETLMVADDLTVKKFQTNGDHRTVSQYKETLQFLKKAGYAIGGHTVAELNGAPSGCGANDKLPAIYEYIARNEAVIRMLAEQLGYEVSDADHELIFRNAAARSEFSAGNEILEALQTEGGQIDVLEGGHKEVLAVVNRRFGTTLDRDAVRSAFGDNYQAFNVDEWSFEEAARVISGDDADEARIKRIAMLYDNLATAGVLCGPNMRVVVLD